MKTEDFKPADRVRVKLEFEGVVNSRGLVEPINDDLLLPSFVLNDLLRFEGATVERVARPFKPGDLVRSKTHPYYFFLLGEKHYHSFTPAGSRIWRYGFERNAIDEAFPQDRYELVEVG